MALALNGRTHGKFLFSRVNYPYLGGYQSPDGNNCPSFKSQRRNYSNCDEDNPIKCKVAIVTGGARGIGYHIADQFLAAGAQAVIIGDVLVDECEKVCCKWNEKYGENKALFQPLDVTKKDQMEKIFKCTKDRFGKIDIVVNNAGILADKRWEQTIAININGVVLGTLLGFQYMTAEKCGPGGIIINVASILGLQPLYSSPVYVGTKHFGVGFTRSMGHEYFCKTSKVKVMAVCPGVTDTHMITEASQGGLPGFGDLGKELACSLGALPAQPAEEVGKGVITMIKDGENGSIWVSEGKEFYKAILPDRKTFKPPPPCPPPPCPPPPCPPPPPKCPPPKEDPCKKKEDPCKKKEDPCKKKEDPCKKKEDPCKKKEDPCKKKEDPCKKKEDPCKKKEDPCKKKEEPPKKEEKKDACKKDDKKPGAAKLGAGDAKKAADPKVTPGAAKKDDKKK